MDFDTFDMLIKQHPRPVILVEGTREVSPQDRPQLVAFGRWLARTYPHAVFRTGNAKGANEVDLNQAVFGIFYVNAADPMKGGTGHTIRVCQTLGIPVSCRDQWMGWMAEA